MRRTAAFVMLFLFAFCTGPLLRAQTVVSGNIFGAVTWKKESSPYVVTAPLQVTSGATLTLNAGVVVKFAGDHPFDVYGRLRVNGLPGDSVRFAGVPEGDTVRSAGIRILSGGRAAVRNAIVEGFRNGFWATSGSSIDTFSSVMFRRNTIGLRSESPLIAGGISGEGNLVGMQFNGAIDTIRTVTGVHFNGNAVGVECRNSGGEVRILDGSMNGNQTAVCVRSGNFFGQGLQIQQNDTGAYIRSGFLTLRSSIIRNSVVAGVDLFGGAMELSEDTVELNADGIKGNGTGSIANSVIRRNTSVGVSLEGSIICSRITVAENGVIGVIAGSNCSVQQSWIEENDSIGIVLDGSQITVKNCSIARNGSFGVLERNDAAASLHYNNIRDNGTYDLVMTTQNAGQFNAMENYWGTNDLATVFNRIYDQNDVPSLKLVAFNPRGTEPYAIFGNADPSFKLGRTTKVRKDTVIFNYILNDTEKNALQITGEYRSASNIWLPMTVSGKTTSITSAEYTGSITWIAGKDLPHTTMPVLVRWRSSDSSGTSPWDTLTTMVENNDIPSVKITALTGTLRTAGVYRDTLHFTVTVTDPEQDSGTVRLYYRRDTIGGAWKQGTIVQGGVRLPPGVRMVDWLSTADIPMQPGSYFVTIIPFDFKDGTPDSEHVMIDNYGASALTIAKTMVPVYSGAIRIPVSVQQYDPHPVTYLGQFSTNQGTVWLPATLERSQSVSGAVQFDDTITWLSGTDLTGWEAEGIQVRLTPLNPVPGFPDTITGLHIDNNAPPHADTLRVYAPRVVEDVVVSMGVTDAERDNYQVHCDYRVQTEAEWHTATIVNLFLFTDSCRWVWKSAKDLYNRNVPVFLRAYAFDTDTSEIVHTVAFVVDNVTGPVLKQGPSALIRTDDSVSFTFDRPLRPSSIANGITVTSRHTGTVPMTRSLSADGKVITMFRSSRFQGADTITFRILGDTAIGLKDTSGNAFDGDKDEDLEGSPVDDMVFDLRTPIPGDYDLDGEVSITDLALFRTYWTGKKLRYELGPATGVPPFMQTTGDGVIDFEDLMVFVQNWNWTAQHRIPPQFAEERIAGAGGRSSELLELIPSGMNGKTRDGIRRFSVASMGTGPLTAMECVIRYDPSQATYAGWQTESAEGEAAPITLSYHDSLQGFIILSVAPDAHDTKGRFGSVAFRPLAGAEHASLQLSYTLIAADGICRTGKGTVHLDDGPALPLVYGLEQNFPNPFNPSTTVRYQIPAGGHVRLELYSVLGQRLLSVVDAHREAGFHSAVIDGSALASGTYLCRLQVNGFVSVRRMVLLK